MYHNGVGFARTTRIPALEDTVMEHVSVNRVQLSQKGSSKDCYCSDEQREMIESKRKLTVSQIQCAGIEKARGINGFGKPFTLPIATSVQSEKLQQFRIVIRDMLTAKYFPHFVHRSKQEL